MAKRAPKFKAVLFDIDGTLLDTREMIFQSFEHTLAKHSVQKNREEIRFLIGKTAREIYKTLAPTIDTQTLIDTHFAFQSKILHVATVFPHVFETLKTLKAKGVKIAAFSNRIRTSRKSLEIAGLTPLFDVIITAEDVTHPKPHPEIIEKALTHLEIKPKNAAIVGDTESDILTGKNAGVVTIGVTYGFHGEKLAESKPDFLVDDISAILPIILNQS